MNIPYTSLWLFLYPMVISLAYLTIDAREVDSLSLESNAQQTYHNVNFNDIPVIEFIRYVSKISQENFIFNNKELDFHVTFSSGKPIPVQQIVSSLVKLLRTHHFHVVKEEHSYVIYKPRKRQDPDTTQPIEYSQDSVGYEDSFLLPIKVKKNFHVYKLQYHEGAEIVESLKKIGEDLSSTSAHPDDLLQAVQGLQWVKATNSFLFSGLPETITEMKKIISRIDVPLRQVFIEVLVIETDVKKSLDYGLQWAAGGQLSDKVGFGTGSFAPPGGNSPSFTSMMQGAGSASKGLGQIPVVPGFDLGVIGDIILHKGRSYLTLGSLVSALQADGDSTIVLNQKIITQDNKHSKIFVGDNIPFTGSVVQTMGQGQQTTANIEYRDVGVSLNITPMLGEGDVITLDLDEEITEAVEDNHFGSNNSSVGGIRTTKTNMLTHVHVPDKHFLVLSGMIRNAKSTYKAGIPFLSSIPIIGSLFSKTKKMDAKRNIIIFVRPQIIHSFQEFEKITSLQEDVVQKMSNPQDFSDGVNILPSMP
ncbi:MAG: secretin N-terminal domain-containing protein [Chlamydiia bacterium]